MTTAVGRIARRGGSISLTWMPEQDVLLVEGKGYVGLGMVREDLQRAGTFGKEHSNGWTYIADTSKVRLANPLNLIYLRRIPQLPNLRAYITVVPSWVLRAVAGVLSPIFKPDAVVRTREEALAAAARDR